MSAGVLENEAGNGVVSTDKHGYLLNYMDWSEAVAKAIADVEGIELTSDHWDVLFYLRTHYIQYRYTPNVRLLVKVLTKAWGKKAGGKKRLYELFPAGPARQGCKIAGLPLPIDCIDWD